MFDELAYDGVELVCHVRCILFLKNGGTPNGGIDPFRLGLALLLLSLLFLDPKNGGINDILLPLMPLLLPVSALLLFLVGLFLWGISPVCTKSIKSAASPPIPLKKLENRLPPPPASPAGSSDATYGDGL